MKQRNEAALASDEAERGVLGRLIADDRLFYEHSSRLKEDDFADQRHREIYGAIRRLVDRGVLVTRPALIAEITGDDVEIPAYVAALVAGACQTNQLGPLVDVIARYAGRRRLISAADAIKDKALKADPAEPIDEIRQAAVNQIEAVDDSSAIGGNKFGVVLQRVIDNAGKIIKEGRPPGLRSGLKCFDDLVGSLLPGQMIVIAGESGGGKTSLATQIAYLTAAHGIPVWFTSLEMSEDEIVARVFGTKGNISADKIQEGNISAAELDRLFGTVGVDLADLPIWLDDSPAQSTATIQARLARSQIKYGVKLGVIDHLQFVHALNRKVGRTEQIEDNVNGIKAIAKRLKMPIILVSHVSRQAEWRQMHTADDIQRPVISDLYGSSAIEKAADAIIFVHRPGWFLERMTPPEKKREKWTLDRIRWQGKAELVLPKRRGGKGFGISLCEFDEERTWFSDPEEKNNVELVKEQVGGHDYGAPPWDNL